MRLYSLSRLEGPNLVLCFSVLGTTVKVSHVLSQHPAAELHPRLPSCLLILRHSLHKLPWLVLNLPPSCPPPRRFPSQVPYMLSLLFHRPKLQGSLGSAVKLAGLLLPRRPCRADIGQSADGPPLSSGSAQLLLPLPSSAQDLTLTL